MNNINPTTPGPAEVIDQIRIRPFCQNDRSLVVDFFAQMSGETRGFFDRGNGNRTTALKYFDGDTSKTDRFLAEWDGRMVGYVFLWDMDAGVPWLGIAVAEDMKGKHLGRRLIEHAHNHARQCGKGGVMLTTSFANVRGQSLYERMGYERLGTHTSNEVLYIHRFKN
jgi:ribosomal protein S18 acetylase RimI-like enzyme